MQKNLYSFWAFALMLVCLPAVAQKTDYSTNYPIIFGETASDRSNTKIVVDAEKGGKTLTLKPSGADKVQYFAKTRKSSLATFTLDEEASKIAGVKIYNLTEGDVLYKKGNVDITSVLADNKRILEAETGVLIVYSGYNFIETSNTKGITDASPALVFAKDEATAQAWWAKAKDFVREKEGKITQPARTKKSEEIKTTCAKVRMPKAGELNTPENLKKAEKAIRKDLGDNGYNLRKIVLVEDDWTPVRNELTGAVIKRHTWICYAVSYKNDTPEGGYEIFAVQAWQEFNGTEFSNAWKLDSHKRETTTGDYILEENIDK